MSDLLKEIPPEVLFGQCVQTTVDLIRQGPIEIAREEQWLRTWVLNGFRTGANAEDRDAAQELLERLISTHPRHLDATLFLARTEKLKNVILPILVPIPPSKLNLHQAISSFGPKIRGVQPIILEQVIANIGVHYSNINSIPKASAFGCGCLPPDIKWIDHYQIKQRGWATDPTIQNLLAPVFDLLEAATS